MGDMFRRLEGPILTFSQKIVLLLVGGAVICGAYCYIGAMHDARQTSATASPAAAPAPSDPVEIGVAYGSEKEKWLRAAVDEFARTPRGSKIKVNLIKKGSIEGAQEILRGDDAAKKINAWAPASSLYKHAFVQDWQDKFGNNPILKEEQLALTPMVFVFWEERYDLFVQKYHEVSFKTIGQALNEKGGWDAIAGKSTNWGYFKFGHTHPTRSNSGLATLLLMGYEFDDKSRDLTLANITAPDFQTWMNGIEHAASDNVESTGTLMRDMVLKGPSTYDALFVYESVVIDYLKNAEGRSGRLHVVYPKYNIWNDNPYYVLDTTWSTPEQRQASQQFLDFLMSDTQQRQSLVHGFRPGDPNVAIKFPQSPFVLFESYGLQVDLPVVCEAPKPEVIQNLLVGWQRSNGDR